MPPSNFPIVCCLLEVKNLQAQILLLAALDARRLDTWTEQVAKTLGKINASKTPHKLGLNITLFEKCPKRSNFISKDKVYLIYKWQMFEFWR